MKKLNQQLKPQIKKENNYMALIINQGKQDTTQDNKFNPITEKNVLAQITEIKLATTQTNTLEVTMRLLNGANKGRFVFDRVSYDPTSDFSWKYRALRKAAGCPYNENESAQIDIEKILLNKAVTVDLGIRKGKNKDGVEQEYQNITYKVIKQPAQANAPVAPATPAPTKPAPVHATTPVATPTNEDSTVTPAPVQEPSVPNLTDDTEWD
jgi:hypothetical protein